jgi:nitrate reductase gamma subunit
MKFLVSLAAVLALVLLAYLGTEVAGWHSLFAVVLPYAAILVLLIGIVTKVVSWARSPVPFRIPTSCGQQKSLPWIKQNKLDNPSSTWGVIGRMLLEVLFFRSLFRNTRMDFRREDGKVVYGPTKWLWLAGLAFHYSFLVIFFRHLRFFTEPVPGFVRLVQDVDGFFQVGVPVFYITSLALLGAVGYLLVRRLYIPQMRYISLINDYFPLLLILGIGATGFLLRHLVKTDVVGIKELGMGLLSLQPVPPAGVHWLFYSHLLLVCVLFLYFPFSKLMHMAGVFLSPARNLANNNRAVRHINPWNYPVHVHTYEEYEDEFRDKMVAAGLPVDKE